MLEVFLVIQASCSVPAVEPGQPPLEGRLIQCFLYTRTPGMPDDNHYAHPLDMVVNLDLNSRKVCSWQKPEVFC